MKRIFTAAIETLDGYVKRLLNDCGYRITGVDELAVYRVLELTWKRFKGRD